MGTVFVSTCVCDVFQGVCRVCRGRVWCHDPLVVSSGRWLSRVCERVHVWRRALVVRGPGRAFLFPLFSRVLPMPPHVAATSVAPRRRQRRRRRHPAFRNMLDAEDLSALVPTPPKNGGKKRQGAPRKTTLRKRAPADVLDTDDAFGHLRSLTSGWSGSGSTVEGLLKAVRKEAAEYVVARQSELVREAREAAARLARPRRSSLDINDIRRGRDAIAAPAALASAEEADPAPEPADTPSRRATPQSLPPDGAALLSSATAATIATAPPRPALEHALRLEEAQRAAAADRIAQCRRLAALPSAPTPDDFVALGAHYTQQGEHHRAAATLFQGLFRQAGDPVLAESFRESLAAIARMRHSDCQLPPGSFLPELCHGRGRDRDRSRSCTATASEEAAQSDVFRYTFE